jgi:hypothetical protein
MMSESVLDSYRLIFNVISLSAKNTHAVLAADTGRLICFTNWMQTAKAMETEPNTRVWYFINTAKVIPKSINLNLPFEYVFDAITGAFLKKQLDEDLVARYLVLSEKSAVYDNIHRTINQEREHINASLVGQAYIYQCKVEEAKDILSGNSVDSQSHPYLYDYCQLEGISSEDAARLVLDKNMFVQARLLETESIRMKYMRAVRMCGELLELNQLLDEFNREACIYGRF